MKRHVLPFLLMLIAVISPGEAGINSLNLEAHEVGSGQTVQHNWETDYGSYDSTYYQSKRILVLVRDLSRKADTVRIQVYFIARPKDLSGPLFIYNAQDFSISMNGRIESIGVVGAPDLKSHVENLVLLGSRRSSGSEHAGWIVTGELNGTVFQVRASNQSLLEVAQDNPRQTQTLRGMLAEYKPPNKKKSQR